MRSKILFVSLVAGFFIGSYVIFNFFIEMNPRYLFPVCAIPSIIIYILCLYLSKHFKLTKFVQPTASSTIIFTLANIVIISAVFLFPVMAVVGGTAGLWLFIIYGIPVKILFTLLLLASFARLAIKSQTLSDTEYLKRYGNCPMFSWIDFANILILFILIFITFQ